MSSQTTYCPFCGSEVEPSATFCGNCGAAIDQKPVQTPPPAQTQPYATQPTYKPATSTQSVETEIEGIIGLVLGVLSCIGVLPLIGSIVGVILGHIARRKSKTGIATIALVISYLGIAIYIIVPVIVIVVLFSTGYWYYF
ncbi:MAG: zinc-ribbon domain-containing protein [Asgard group archaeon]|nr:zinc-ribbon domain-containing protein [Asgard group archaeon]